MLKTESLDGIISVLTGSLAVLKANPMALMFPIMICARRLNRLNTKQDILCYVLSDNNHFLFEIKEGVVELCGLCSGGITRQCSSEDRGTTYDNTFECIKELKSVVVALKTKKAKHTLKRSVHPAPPKGANHEYERQQLPEI